MSDERFKYAMLGKAQVDKLRELEDKMGLMLVAYEEKPVLADLSDEQLTQLKEAEEEFGVILVAYEEM